MKQGVYIHVPFCFSKCPYCSFTSFPVRAGVPGTYVSAVLRDIALEVREWESSPFATVYFGGGTPSLLSPEEASTVMSALRDRLPIDADAEVTLECNPATVGAEALSAFRRIGINRLSIGVQSLGERELLALGRIHRPEDAVRAITLSRAAGFDNISVDVMLGVPGQTRRSLACTLGGLVDLVDHVSVYMLTVERGTLFHTMAARGLFAPPDDCLLADFYGQAADLLASSGLRRYEISNWAREGRRCLHNMVYWERGNYLGIGAGSHSHRAGRRYSKLRDPRQYARSLASGSGAVDFEEKLTEEQVMLEQVLLSLRTERGLDLGALVSGGAARARFGRRIGDLVGAGYAVTDGKHLTLSPKGLLLHDEISAEISVALCATAA